MGLEYTDSGGVRCAAAAENSIATCRLDSGNDRAGRCRAFNEDNLILHISFDLVDSFDLGEGFGNVFRTTFAGHGDREGRLE